jgi:hypothetical protein
VKRSVVSLATVVTVLILGLAACSAPSPTVESGAGLSTSRVAPQPAPSSAAIPTSGPVPVVDSGPCAPSVPALPVQDKAEVEQLGGATLAVPFDSGAMPHAMGEAILDGQGVPVAYTVAANDTFAVVGARFCVGELWLHWVNAVRRDGDALYVGDILNLDAHTILRVGDQNGVVHDNPLPAGFAIPPQR